MRVRCCCFSCTFEFVYDLLACQEGYISSALSPSGRGGRSIVDSVRSCVRFPPG